MTPPTARENAAILRTLIAYPELLEVLLLTPSEFAAMPDSTATGDHALLAIEEAFTITEEAG